MPPTNQENADEIIAQLKHRSITHILPSRDGELLFWARLKNDLKSANIHVLSSNESAIELCLDKLRFGQCSIPFIIPSFESIEAVKKVVQDTQPLHYVVKERFGAGSKAVGLNLNENDAVQYAKGLSSPIFQLFKAGKEISVDAWLTKRSFG